MFTGTGNILKTLPVNQAVVVEKEELPVTTKEIVEHYFVDAPILAEVAKCESRFTHFTESGKVLRGEIDSRDIGVMQINEYYHRDTAEKLGLDIETLEGNLAYAQYLYDKQGLAPWKASSKCWSKSMHLAVNTK